MTRYARQEILSEIGPEGQARLGAARMLVVGAGGLAAGALPLLAGAGVGQLRIVDHDLVDLSNLHRQHLFSEADVGKEKAVAAAARCGALNSDCAAEAICARLTPANANDLLDGIDVVLDCADSYAVSYILSDMCYARRTPLITASALGLSGYVAGICGGAPSLRAVFPDAPQSAATCATAGVMGPVVTVLGAWQAQMALSVSLGLDPSPLGQMLQLDARSYRSNAFRFDEAPEPDHTFDFVSQPSLSRKDLIIELRGADEAPLPVHPSAIRHLPETMPPTSVRIALCCATGLRAWRTAETLSQTWPGDIVLVAASAS